MQPAQSPLDVLTMGSVIVAIVAEFCVVIVGIFYVASKLFPNKDA